MKSSTESGVNRTGIGVSPQFSQELIEVTLSTEPSAPGDDRGLGDIRLTYAQNAEPLGSLPSPLEAEAEETADDQPLVARFMDKLGERLAFERTGVRLYQALLSKLESNGALPGGPTREELLHIQEEELGHFELVKSALESMGADPTAVTPSADVAGIVSAGIPQVLADPRTTLRQCLDAVLVAELADNDAWALLVKMCEELDEDVLANQFRLALRAEVEHLDNVRRWIQQTTLSSDTP